MTFGRTDAEWWRITPAQLGALAEAHRNAHDPKRAKASADQGTASDLLAFQSMRRV